MLIAFEGGEGSGKSTQARRLADWLREGGVAVTTTHEPGATAFGLKVRSILLDSGDGALTPRAEALLFAADRAHHVDTVIRPALDRGDVVITDRYADSSLAYQGAGRALSLDDIRRLSRWATNGLRPDLTILLDVEPEVGLQRARSAGRGPDRLEREPLEFHQRVRRAFRALADAAPDCYLVVDASRRPEAVAAMARSAVGRRLAARLAAQQPAEAAGRGRWRRWFLRRRGGDAGSVEPATVAARSKPVGPHAPARAGAPGGTADRNDAVGPGGSTGATRAEEPLGAEGPTGPSGPTGRTRPTRPARPASPAGAPGTAGATRARNAPGPNVLAEPPPADPANADPDAESAPGEPEHRTRRTHDDAAGGRFR
jgi:dTMP kinase